MLEEACLRETKQRDADACVWAQKVFVMFCPLSFCGKMNSDILNSEVVMREEACLRETKQREADASVWAQKALVFWIAMSCHVLACLKSSEQ